MQFEELSLSKSILKAILEKGYSTPTPIQEKAIPIVLEGSDLIGCAQTGTGKTAAFAIPIIHYLHRVIGSSKKTKTIRTLIVTPTRELALQIGENIDYYSKYTNLRQLTIFGGVSQIPQVDQLKKGVDILIATPGRLLDLNKQGFVNLNQIHHLVLDEADQMLDMGFIGDVKKIIKLTPNNRQTLLFSATMPLPIRELADQFLIEPKMVQVNPIASTVSKIEQKVYFVEKSEKKQLLYHVIRNNKISNALIFSRTKFGAENIVKSLQKNGLNAQAIHGDKSQNARQNALEQFKNKEIQFLVATDIAARGIDIEKLPFVINFDLPNIPETYVHRIGRTARAGQTGETLSFCAKDEEVYWKDIVKLTKADFTVVSDHPFEWKSLQAQVKVETESENTKKSSNRKSVNSKKNKKRWY